jgi:hypothetical protein
MAKKKDKATNGEKGKASKITVKPLSEKGELKDGTPRKRKAPLPLSAGDKFIASYKKTLYAATAIEKADGGIQFRANGNKVYRSLTAAAADIVGIDLTKPGRRISGRKFFRPADEVKIESAGA